MQTHQRKEKKRCIRSESPHKERERKRKKDEPQRRQKRKEKRELSSPSNVGDGLV